MDEPLKHRMVTSTTVSRLVASALAVLAFALTAAAPASAAAQPAKPLPVPWNASSFISGGQNPDKAPGANDFSCKPSAAHPRPVVLVHGLLATMGDNWATMSPLLKNNGFCVFALTYGRRPGFDYFGGINRMEGSAKELDALVEKVRRSTGAAKVDLVGHSEGTVMPRWWMSFMGGAALVNRYVMLTPLWDGTKLAAGDLILKTGKLLSPGAETAFGQLFDLGGCGSCPEFVHGSSYLAAVDKAGKALPGVTYTNIVTKYDELVSPYTSGILNAPNSKSFVLQDVCSSDYSEHAAVAYDPMAAQLMLNALDPAHARKVPCTLMLPSGAPEPPAVGLARAKTCMRGRTITIAVRPRRGERIRSITATVGGKRVASRRGRALRSIRIAGLRPGRRTIRLRLRSNLGARSLIVRRTVRCR